MEIIREHITFRWISLALVFPLVLFRFYFFHGEWEHEFSLSQILTNYLTYFTIQNNLLVSFWFFITIFRKRFTHVFNFCIEKRIFEALLFYALCVVIVYWSIIFRHQPKYGTTDIVLKAFLHINLLGTLLFDYIFNIKKQKIRFGQIMWWMIYPTIYGILVILYTIPAHWAPYPFLDWHQMQQQSSMIVAPFFILAGMTLIGIVFIFIHNYLIKS